MAHTPISSMGLWTMVSAKHCGLRNWQIVQLTYVHVMQHQLIAVAAAWLGSHTKLTLTVAQLQDSVTLFYSRLSQLLQDGALTTPASNDSPRSSVSSPWEQTTIYG